MDGPIGLVKLTTWVWGRQTNFYVTESGAYKQQVFYFRHDDWDTACRPIFRELQTSAYDKLSQVHPLPFLLLSACFPLWSLIPSTVSQEDLLYHDGHRRQLTHSYVRLLPKEFGVRPIINLKRKPAVPPASSTGTGTRWGGRGGGKVATLMSVNSTLKEVFEVLVLKKVRLSPSIVLRL
jgi:hypothetical protein